MNTAAAVPTSQPPVRLTIKHMCCRSCVKVAKSALIEAGVSRIETLGMGGADVVLDDPQIGMRRVLDALRAEGFDLAADRDSQLAEAIKWTVLEIFYHGNNTNTILRNSDHLTEKLGHSYGTLSRIFSQQTGLTLERYILRVKIERVKEMIANGDMTLSEIAYRMGYPSVQYLSTQFRQIVGITVSDYKRQPVKTRVSLDRLAEVGN